MDTATGRAPLAGILETVLYCTSPTEADTRLFYERVRCLRKVSKWTYRLGPRQVLLLFNAEETKTQKWPPAHGATGAGHACFTVPRDAYEGWKAHLAVHNVDIIEEIDWSRGILSFYFCDPAGNVLEIANGDMWPE